MSRISFLIVISFFFFFSSRRRHTRFDCDWSSDVCSSDLYLEVLVGTGICGLFPILLALTGTWWLLTRAAAESLSRPLERQLATEGLGVLTVITAHSFFSVELMWHPALVFLVILGFAEFLRRSQGYKTTVPAWAVSASHSWR